MMRVGQRNPGAASPDWWTVDAIARASAANSTAVSDDERGCMGLDILTEGCHAVTGTQLLLLPHDEGA